MAAEWWYRLSAAIITEKIYNLHRPGWLWAKLQALVYDILPSITAVFTYAIRSRKLSANEQFLVGAQTVVSLLQTTQIISDVCFITDHVTYASSNNTQIVWIETELLKKMRCSEWLWACVQLSPEWSKPGRPMKTWSNTHTRPPAHARRHTSTHPRTHTLWLLNYTFLCVLCISLLLLSCLY